MGTCTLQRSEQHAVKCLHMKRNAHPARTIDHSYVPCTADSRKATTSAHKYANNRFLNTPQKADKLKTLKSRVKSAEREIQKLKEKIQESSEVSGVNLDEALHHDLLNIMKSKITLSKTKFPGGTFRRLFWSE